MGCCLGSEQEGSLDRLSIPRKEFRNGRIESDFGKHTGFKKTIQCICTTLMLYKPNGCGLIISAILSLVCVFQLVYDLFVVCGCPAFDCGFLEKKLEGEATTNGSSSHHSTFRKTSNTVYTLASFGGLFSYTLLLISLLLMQFKKRKESGNWAIGPSDTLYNDLSNRQVKLLFVSIALSAILFVASVSLFYYLIRDQPKDGYYFYLMIVGVAAQFLAQWAAVVGCHVFAVSSFALGTLASDTIRRIRYMTKDQSNKRSQGYGATDTQPRRPTADLSEKESADDDQGVRSAEEGRASNPEIIEVDKSKVEEKNGTSQVSFDVALEYHEELCEIVSDTVTAYCPWFVVHWFCYGATCLVGVIYLSEEYTYSRNPQKLAYVTIFLVMHLYMFLLPCCCAAYITDTCGGIYSIINKTTSKYWLDGHPFKERAQLAMFTDYVKNRQCVFRIGRLTFTSTLAWISLLLGSTGLLFHFF